MTFKGNISTGETTHFFSHSYLLINSTTISQVHCVPDPGISTTDTEINRKDKSQFSGSSIVIVVRIYRGGRSRSCHMGTEGARGVKNSFLGEVLNVQDWVKFGFTNRKFVGEISPGRRTTCAKIHRQERVRGIPGAERSQNDCGTEPRQRVVGDEETRSHGAF